MREAQRDTTLKTGRNKMIQQNKVSFSINRSDRVDSKFALVPLNAIGSFRIRSASLVTSPSTAAPS